MCEYWIVVVSIVVMDRSPQFFNMARNRKKIKLQNSKFMCDTSRNQWLLKCLELTLNGTITKVKMFVRRKSQESSKTASLVFHETCSHNNLHRRVRLTKIKLSWSRRDVASFSAIRKWKKTFYVNKVPKITSHEQRCVEYVSLYLCCMY